jgi:hypothetical protein
MKTKLARSPLIVTVLLYSCVLLFGDVGTHWMQYCEYYDTFIIDSDHGCNVDSNYNCIGNCSKVTFPTGTASCGACHPTFNPFSWCTTASSPTMTTVTSWQVPCEWVQTGQNSPESVEWTCSCGSDWAIHGTTTVGCWCN